MEMICNDTFCQIIPSSTPSVDFWIGIVAGLILLAILWKERPK